MNQEVVQYIREAKQHGLADQEIKQNLLDAGWDAAIVEQSFSNVKLEETKQIDQPPAETGPTATTEAEHEPFPASTNDMPARPVTLNIEQQPKPVIQAPHWVKNKLLWGGAIALLVLGTGGYFAYAYVKDNPQAVWKKFTQTLTSKNEQQASKIYQNNFKISYHDPLTIDKAIEGEASFLSKLKDFTVSFEGSFYVDYSKDDSTQSSSNVKYSFGSGNTSFTTGLEYRLLGDTLYVNAGDNPLLTEMLSYDAKEQLGDKKLAWIMLNFKELEKQLSSNDMSEYKSAKEFFDPSYRKKLNKLWEDTTLVKIEKTLGKEKVNGVDTIHYKNKLDKEALKKLMSQYIDESSKNAGDWITEDDIKIAKLISNAIIGKLEVKEFETWIGSKDFNLYKVHILSTAPSLISAINSNWDQTQTKYEDEDAADRQRLSDLEYGLKWKLDTYKSSHQGYPDAVNGIPDGYIKSTTTNISSYGYYTEDNSIFPLAPAASGNCTDYINTYWYQPTGTTTMVNGKKVYSDYEITFCLGKNIQGYQAGVARMTSKGVEDNIACPVKPEQCYKDPAKDTGEHDIWKRKEAKIKDAVSKIAFSAEFRVDADYHDYGKQLKLETPSDAFDIVKMIASARGNARNAKRLNDVKQLSSALELYNNDKGEYPKDFSVLTPAYIGAVPTPPEPAEGTCSEDDNKYTYTKKSTSDYTLTFCLGGQTGGYTAGKHTLSPLGIQ